MPASDFTLPPNVIKAIAFLFAPEDHETITRMLIEECNAEKLYSTSEAGLERIQLAVLKLSNGEPDKFLAAAELVQLDWRDVLVAAGFGDDLEAHLKWVSEIIKK